MFGPVQNLQTTLDSFQRVLGIWFCAKPYGLDQKCSWTFCIKPDFKVLLLHISCLLMFWIRKISKCGDIVYVCVSHSVVSKSLDHMDCSPPGSSVHGLSRQEYWSGLPGPPAGIFLIPNCRHILYSLNPPGNG